MSKSTPTFLNAVVRTGGPRECVFPILTGLTVESVRNLRDVQLKRIGLPVTGLVAVDATVTCWLT